MLSGRDESRATTPTRTIISHKADRKLSSSPICLERDDFRWNSCFVIARERSDEAIQTRLTGLRLDCFVASLPRNDD
jgi:hypothetical protein